MVWCYYFKSQVNTPYKAVGCISIHKKMPKRSNTRCFTLENISYYIFYKVSMTSGKDKIVHLNVFWHFTLKSINLKFNTLLLTNLYWNFWKELFQFSIYTNTFHSIEQLFWTERRLHLRIWYHMISHRNTCKIHKSKKK